MSRKLSKKAIKSAIENRINKAYTSRCGGIQIDIMDITRVFQVGQKLVDSGADDVTLAQGIFDYVQTIRKN